MSSSRRKRAARAELGRAAFGGDKPARSTSSLRREAQQPKRTLRRNMLVEKYEQQVDQVALEGEGVQS